MDVSPSGDGGTADGDTLRLWDLASGEEMKSWGAQDLSADLFTIGRHLLPLPETSQVILRPYSSQSFYVLDTADNSVMAFDSGMIHIEGQSELNAARDQFAVLGYLDSFEEEGIFISNIMQGPPSDLVVQNVIPVKGLNKNLSLIALNPIRPEIFGVSLEGEAQIWNTETGEILNSAKYEGYIRAAAYSPDGEMLANNGPIHIYDARTLEEITVLRQEELDGSYGPSPLSFSQDGKLIVTTSRNSYESHLALLDASADKLPTLLPVKGDLAVFAENDTLLITAGYDGTIRFWGIPSS